MAGKSQLGSSVRKAAPGERMIEIKVRFWTNDIGGPRGTVRQKHAWASGMVRIERNKTHAISPGKPRPFHSLMDMSAVIEKVLIDHGIVLHRNKRMRKYFDSQ